MANADRFSTRSQEQRDLAFNVTDSVGYALAGALLGWLIVYGITQTTPLRPPGWVGVAVGAALGSAAQWQKENQR